MKNTFFFVLQFLVAKGKALAKGTRIIEISCRIIELLFIAHNLRLCPLIMANVPLSELDYSGITLETPAIK